MLPCFYRSGSSGNSTWEARFTPRRVGTYTYTVTVRKASEEGRSAPKTLRVDPAPGDGLLSMDAQNYFVLRFDSGRLFRGVGSNFNNPSGSNSNEKMLGLFKQHRMNFMRTWVGPGNMNLEANGTGVGNYSEAEAEKVDAFLALAAKNGVYLMSAMDTFGKYLLQDSKFGGGGSWYQNPYAKEKGGPASSPTDFLKNPRAMDFYKRRIRYAVARWGYHPNLAVWEFWNEVDQILAPLGGYQSKFRLRL